MHRLVQSLQTQSQRCVSHTHTPHVENEDTHSDKKGWGGLFLGRKKFLNVYLSATDLSPFLISMPLFLKLQLAMDYQTFKRQPPNWAGFPVSKQYNCWNTVQSVTPASWSKQKALLAAGTVNPIPDCILAP